MKVGKRLRQIMTEQGKKPGEVARLAGIRPQRLSDWLSDVAVRDIRQLKSVCKVLNVSLDELLFPDEDGKTENLFNETNGWLSGKFEIKVRRLK